ncbi:ATP-binding cassette domain-containing protein [Leucobacter musarum]|uniref:ATP-binding cassette domain-containing protein n=1 Tax=Leucobacter musarum TaxID=1930747 RepID=UPI0006A783D6|nr:ATP-binding cassette domain-containing protein [Leucobacter musarum]
MTYVLQAKGLAKKYGHVTALDGADFAISPGEIVSLIGDNGAGKSTLVRMLSGSDTPDSGDIYFEGKPVKLQSPTDSQKLGMETVYQDLSLAPHLSAVRNIFLGREIMRKGALGWFGFMNTAEMNRKGREALIELGATVRNFSGPVGSMSGGQKQSIAVCRAATWAQKVIFLDEPTAALGVVQTQNVLDLVKRVRDTGIAVVFISHSMPHVMEVSDRIVVMRRGRDVANYTPENANMEKLVGSMTGAIEVQEA